jgi:hypothetical protein
VASFIANHQQTDRCRYTVALARPVLELARIVETILEAQLIDHDRLRATIEYARGDDAAALLLDRLITNRVPVASFIANQPDLEQAYLMAGIAQVE